MADDSGVWVKVFPDFWAEGAPPAPVLTNPEGGSVIKFTSGGDGAAGPTLAYGAVIKPEGPTVTVDQDNLEVSVSGSEPFTDYVVEVYGVNSAGRGAGAKTAAFQLNYNEATGGTVTEYTVLADSTRWRCHTFTGNGTFTVGAATNPFRVLLVGGGGACKYSANKGQGGGGAGGMLTNDAQELSAVAHPVTIGAGGTVDTWPNNGGDTTAFGLTAIGGGHGAFRDGGQIGPGSGGSGGGESRNSTGPGGAGTAGQGNNGGSGDSANHGGGGGAGGVGVAGSGGPGAASDITGTTVTYARGGGSDGWDASVQYGAGGNFAGLAAQPGVVIVAYQIGTSTTRQIEQAQAEHAAREAGYATGYDVGVIDGREQAVEEVRAMAASTLEVSE